MEKNLLFASLQKYGNRLTKRATSTILLLLVCLLCSAQTAPPTLYYTFDEGSSLAPTVGTGALVTSGYYATPTGAIGKCISQDSSGSLGFSTPTNLANSTGFTVMFMLKMKRKFDVPRDPYVLQWGNTLLRWYYPEIWFATSRTSGTTNTSSNSKFPPAASGQGVDRSAWGYLHDEEWHHIAVTYNPTTGVKKMYIDGICPNGFSETITLGGTVTQGANQRIYFNPSSFDYQRVYADYDEVAIWNQALDEGYIYQAYEDIEAGYHYTFTLGTPPAAPAQTGTLDIDEFPEGFVIGSSNSSGVTKPQNYQLSLYPLPRYKPGHTMMRMPNWGQLPYMAGLGVGYNTQRQKDTAQAINYELASKWNYYLTISHHLQNTSQDYDDTNKVAGVLVRQANRYTYLPGSIIGYHNQMRPSIAGFAQDTGYVEAKGLPANYYLRNSLGQWLTSSGSVTTTSSSKCISPIAPPDSLIQDGLAMKYYLDTNLFAVLTRDVSYYGENNEAIPHWSSSVITNDPLVSANKTLTGLSNDGYLGRKAYDIHSYYKGQFNPSLQSRATSFGNDYYYQQYYVMAYDGTGTLQGDREYWREFKQILDPIDGRYLSTIDYYPRRPGQWNVTSGAFKGLAAMIDNVNATIAEQDSFFMPFTCAGYSVTEETNMRPAQYLGNLKNLIGLGAIGFAPAYFSLSAPFPDPKGWIWQFALPAYAQAALSHVSWYENTRLLSGDFKYDAQKSITGYQYYAGRKDNTVIVRQNKTNTDNYLIFSSLQRYTNQANERSPEEPVTITLNGKDVTFISRMQGAMYVYDESDTLLYQLDGWHQYEHPDKWSRDVTLEAELVDGTTPVLKTYGKTGYDFTSAFTAVTYADTATVFDTLKYTFEPRTDTTYYVWVRARSRTGASTSAKIWVNNGVKDTIGPITSTSWYYYRYEYNQTVNKLTWSLDGDTTSIVKLQALNRFIEIDRIILTPDSTVSYPEAVTICALSATINALSSTTFCDGGAVTLSASPTGAGYSYVWSNGAATGINIIDASGTYTVTVYDGAGCSGSASQAVTEYPAVTAPTLTTTPVSGYKCAGDMAAVDPDAVYTSYLWSNGETTQGIITTAPGIYNLVVTDANGCTKQSVNSGVIYDTSPIVPLITRLTPTTICYDSSASFVCTTPNVVSYTWHSDVVTAFPPVLVIGTNDTLTTDTARSVKLMVTDSLGCYYVSPDTFTIRYYRCDTCEQPRALAVGGITANAATVSWGLLTNAVRFVVSVQNQRTMRIDTNTVNSLVRVSRFKGLAASTPYKYWVTAICSDGNQYRSVQRTFTTLRR